LKANELIFASLQEPNLPNFSINGFVPKIAYILLAKGNLANHLFSPQAQAINTPQPLSFSQGVYIMKYIYIVLAIVVLLVGCSPKTGETLTGDVTQNSDDTATTDDTQTATDTTTAAQPKQCDEAVNYQVLVDALPGDMSGYVADEPEGQMLSFTDPSTQNVMKYSTASVTLRKDDKSIRVNLMDTCYIQYLSMAWLGFYEMEGTDGYLKKTTVEGNTGWHQYQKSSDSYTYNLFIAERVIASVEGDGGVPDSDVEAVTKAIDFAAVAAAAK
jgi:hypothetical protein